jgi:hypothetical protein
MITNKDMGSTTKPLNSFKLMEYVKLCEYVNHQSMNLNQRISWFLDHLGLRQFTRVPWFSHQNSWIVVDIHPKKWWFIGIGPSTYVRGISVDIIQFLLPSQPAVV